MTERVDLDWFETALLALLDGVDEAADWDGETESATPVSDAIPKLIAELREHRRNEYLIKREVLLELHELMRPGPERRAAYAALMKLSFKYGAMREIDGMCTIGEFEPEPPHAD